MKQSTYGVIILSAAIILLAALGIRAFLTPASRIPGEYADAITEYDNGDFVYRFEPEAIAFDESQKMIYAQNLLAVYTASELSRREKQALADRVGGIIVGDIHGSMNVLQLYVDEPTLTGLNALADTLMASEQVLYASHELPVAFDTTAFDDNPWKDTNYVQIFGPENGRGNESEPGGNDWWAEAVGAYTAWSYEDLFHDVTIGMVDSGLNPDHEELEGNAVLLPGYTRNSPNYHGTGVAAVICAKNNDVGLRGIASGSDSKVTLVCADWSPLSNNESGKNYINYLTTGEAVEIMKQMVEADVRAVNNSWGWWDPSYFNDIWDLTNEGRPIPWESKDVYDLWWDNYIQTASIPYLLMSLQMIHQARISESPLQNHGEVLFVQAAGNESRDCKQSGAFCAINEALWNKVIGADTWQGISFDEVRRHILIVASVDNVRNDNGDYQLSSFTCYGPNIDLCAPGREIFTADVNGYRVLQGTSLSAPIVTGGAAVLWAIDPDLTVPEVWSLLCDNTKYSSYTDDENPGTYPIVHIGGAVQALLSSNPSGGVADSGDGADSGSSYGGDPSDGDSSDGAGSGSGDPSGGDGGDSSDGAESDAASDESARGLFKAQLDALAGQYGVIAAGSETYNMNTLQSTRVEIPSGRLTGLLGADIYDYDHDGQLELLTIRLDSKNAEAAGYWTSVSQCYISVYEITPDQSGTVLADECCTTLDGLCSADPSTSIQFARRTRADDKTVLYMDSYYNSLNILFAMAQFSYDGTSLEPVNGFLLSESTYDLNLYYFMDSTVLEKFMPPVSMGFNGSFAGLQGWMIDEAVEELETELNYKERTDGWRNPGSGVNDSIIYGDIEQFLNFFKYSYDIRLEKLGLTDKAPRGDALNPGRWSYDPETWDPYGTNNYRDCVLRPSEHYAGTDANPIIDLCGVLSPYTDNPDATPTGGSDSLNMDEIRLTCYDEGGLLDSYR